MQKDHGVSQASGVRNSPDLPSRALSNLQHTLSTGTRPESYLQDLVLGTESPISVHRVLLGKNKQIRVNSAIRSQKSQKLRLV